MQANETVYFRGTSKVLEGSGTSTEQSSGTWVSWQKSFLFLLPYFPLPLPPSFPPSLPSSCLSFPFVALETEPIYSLVSWASFLPLNHYHYWKLLPCAHSLYPDPHTPRSLAHSHMPVLILTPHT